VRGADVITTKLQKQFQRAQDHVNKQNGDWAAFYKEFQYLAAPVNFPMTHAYVSEIPGYKKVGICAWTGSMQKMEDAHIVAAFNLKVAQTTYPVQLFGVFDGHGGNGAALYLKKNLTKKLQTTLETWCSKGLTNETIWNALKMTFVELDQEFTEDDSGSTATVVLCLDGKLWTANVGDSRAILDNKLQLSEDQSVLNAYYEKGIKRRGGFVSKQRIRISAAPFKIEPSIDVARAIGNRHLGSVVSARPKITVYPFTEIPPGSHLILASDGVFKVASTHQVAEAVQKHFHQSTLLELATNIAYSAFIAGSEDNLTVVVVALKGEAS
jgi:protein phosphatase 1L